MIRFTASSMRLTRNMYQTIFVFRDFRAIMNEWNALPDAPAGVTLRIEAPGINLMHEFKTRRKAMEALERYVVAQPTMH